MWRRDHSLLAEWRLESIPCITQCDYQGYTIQGGQHIGHTEDIGYTCSSCAGTESRERETERATNMAGRKIYGNLSFVSLAIVCCMTKNKRKHLISSDTNERDFCALPPFSVRRSGSIGDRYAN